MLVGFIYKVGGIYVLRVLVGLPFCFAAPIFRHVRYYIIDELQAKGKQRHPCGYLRPKRKYRYDSAEDDERYEDYPSIYHEAFRSVVLLEGRQSRKSE